MQFIPADAYQYLQAMSGMGMPISGSGMDDGYAGYAGYVNTYAQQQSMAGSNASANVTKTSFYLVLAFPQGDFADKIEDHASLPMWVPASGTTPKILGVFGDEKEATVQMDKDSENVHILYHCKVGGREGIIDFLEFMAEHDMLTPTSGK